MDIQPEQLKELIKKLADGTATEEEKLEAIRDLNFVVEEFNKIAKETISENS